MNVELECFGRNFDACQTVAEIAFYMSIDLVNICGKITQQYPYRNEKTQFDILQALGIQLLDSVEQYRNGRIREWKPEEAEFATVDFSKFPADQNKDLGG